MRKENASFATKFISEPGSYLHNSDYFAFVELRDYACYVIADGIDTDEKKESAKLAVTSVITSFSENPGMSAGKLRQYMSRAHKALIEEADQIRLEVSMVILLSDYKKAMWAHAGNSRLYFMRNGAIREVTKDTSLSQKMVDEEEVPLDQLAYHEERNNLYTYLGQPGRFTPVISAKKKLEDGDIFILQTRGVWENVGDAELIDAIEGVSNPEEVCVGLEDVILSQRLDNVENYTIASVFVDKVYNNPKAGKYKKYIKIGIGVAAAVCAILFSVFMMRYQKNKQNISKMEKYKTKGIEYLQDYNYLSAEEQFHKSYEYSENVKAKEGSTNGRKVECIELYDKLSEDLKLAMEAMQNGEYKKASGLYKAALEIANRLKEEYEEDISTYVAGIQSYQDFSLHMYQGTESIKSGNYEDAVDSLDKARNLMNNIDDTANCDVADGVLKSVNAKNFMAQGDDYSREAKEYCNIGMYNQAITAYESARAAYEQAEANGAVEAAAKISSVDIAITNAEGMSNKQSNQDVEKEANDYLDKATQAYHDGKNDTARELYEKAKELFMQTGNNDQVMAIAGKLEEINYGTDAKAAQESIILAMEAMARGDNAQAIVFLTQARDAYSGQNDTVNATRIQAIISQLNQ